MAEDVERRALADRLEEIWNDGDASPVACGEFVRDNLSTILAALRAPDAGLRASGNHVQRSVIRHLSPDEAQARAEALEDAYRREREAAGIRCRPTTGGGDAG